MFAAKAAYYKHSKITDVKRFYSIGPNLTKMSCENTSLLYISDEKNVLITMTSGNNVIKLFSSLLMTRPNKLICTWQSLSSLV